MKGRIHSFESFGTVDGPGIRFIIFMQGCNLQCKFCQNRDTWDVCGGIEYTVPELLAKIERYKSYFVPSGGGVTISGGEPLVQQDFLIELLTALKAGGIHTDIDTAGNFDITDKIKQIINLADLFLLDIKCINDEICKDLTGVSNKLELDFAKYLSSIGKDMWIRQVLVPGYTDKEEDLLNLKQLLSELKTVRRVEILPYHDMGKYKWEQLGCKYELEGVRLATPEDVERAKEILNI